LELPAVSSASACNALPFEVKFDADLQKEFIGDPSFTPYGIVYSHVDHQSPNICWNRWTASRSRFPLPKYPETLTKPSNESFGPNNRERFGPLEESGQMAQSRTNCMCCTARFLLALHVEGQLLPQE
jgi:hypothetical protein